MTSKIPTNKIEVHEDLERGRPLSEEKFSSLISSDDDLEEEDLDETQQKFYEGIKNLARSIEKLGQIEPCCLQMQGGKGMTLTVGYRRYLACKMLNREIEYHTTKGETFNRMLSENVMRENLDPESRAEILAKALNMWDFEEDGYDPTNSDRKPLDAIAGIARGQVYQWLSPLRQSDDMREQFGDVLSETHMRLIEQICNEKDKQMSVAHAVVEYEPKNTREFKDIISKAKEKTDDDSDLAKEVCKQLKISDRDDEKEMVSIDEAQKRNKKKQEKSKKESVKAIMEKQKERRDKERKKQKQKESRIKQRDRQRKQKSSSTSSGSTPSSKKDKNKVSDYGELHSKKVVVQIFEESNQRLYNALIEEANNKDKSPPKIALEILKQNLEENDKTDDSGQSKVEA